MTARPSLAAPVSGLRSNSSQTPNLIGDVASRSLAVLLLLALVAMLACGSGSPIEAEGDNPPQVGMGVIDFTVTNISATPNEVLITDLIVVDADITNISGLDSGPFEVRAFLKEGTSCDGRSYFLDLQTISVFANSTTAFQVSAVPDRVPGIGTYYLCIQVDGTDVIDELSETNNLVGDAMYPVHIVNCLSDAACDDGNPCTDDTCQSTLGCQYAANNMPCDDGLFCTINDQCGGGACQRGEARECIDADLCDGTLYCDELSGACENGPLPATCDDGNACNGAEACNAIDGACLLGTPITCDILVNNGLAPPTASNVINHQLHDEASSHAVLLRDFGCPTFGEPDTFCPAPGTPSTLEVTTPGSVFDMEVFDTSALLMTSGRIDNLASGQDTLVMINGGIVESFEGLGDTMVTGGSHGLLRLAGQSSVTGGAVESLELNSDFISPGAEIRGGVVATLYSGTESSIRGGRISILCAQSEAGIIFGTGFDQNAGTFGALPGTTGFLSGTLESGDPLNATYRQDGAWCYHPVDGTFDTEGIFTLLPPPSAFIANGLVGGSAENTLDANDPATQFHDVVIRNANCPDAWPAATREAACSSPGANTNVYVEAGAVIPGVITVLDQSLVSIRGGQVGTLRTGVAATIEIFGDSFTVDGNPVAFGSVPIAAGLLAGTLASGDPLSAPFDREDPATPGTFGTIVLRASAELGGGG